LETAMHEAEVWDADLHLVYVVETSMFSSIPMDNTWEIIYSLLETEGKEVFEKARTRAEQEELPIETHLRDGHAGSEILTLADEVGSDLIIIGSRGKSNIDRLLLGSVSEHVVRNSSCTTMVVR
ncbi:MAG: universal stress protein, partial [Methanofollis sp.]|nr:universal stress protein [Methanofollis sp.]